MSDDELISRKPMCLNCRSCVLADDYETSGLGKCVYNPPTLFIRGSIGKWPEVYLNSYCRKWSPTVDSNITKKVTK